MKYAIGVDVGATKIAAALIDTRGQVLAARQAQTEASQGSAAVVDRIVDSVRELLGEAPAPVLGVGIGTPGEHQPDQGIVHLAVNLGWRDLPLARLVQEQLGGQMPVWTHNDTRVAALGEYYYGSGQGCANLVYIGIGSGIGSGIVVNGSLLAGTTFNAGEIGHLSLDPDEGLLCECGLHGCVETVVSGVGMIKTARAWLASGKFETRLVDSPDLDTHALLQAAQEGDPLAKALLARAGRWLGTVFAAFAAITNPERIVIGGGLGHAAYDLLVPAATAEMERRVLPTAWQPVKVLPSRLTSSAIGAACLVWMNRGEAVSTP